MFYDPRSEDHGLPHNPWLALIVPRPIGWISTTSAAGVPNLAPYSCFNAIAGRPPFVMFSSDSPKHSVTNAEETGFFCVNIATYPLREAMNRSSAPYPEGTDEFVEAGLTAVPCRIAIGEVVGIHIDERVLRDGLVDVEALQPLGRMGYMEYTVPPRSFTMSRPVLDAQEKAAK